MKTALRSLVVSSAVLASTLGAQSTPLRIEQTVDAQFPHALSLSPITEGEARVIINVDAEGKLADWLVTGYTHKSFADEAVNVLKAWHYTPATDRGQPIGIRMELKFQFEAKGRVVSLMAIETPEVLAKMMGIGPGLITNVAGLDELDKPLAPVNPESPRYPAQAGGPSTQPRSVLVDFYVDEKGQPRMPVVINSPHENYSLAAVDALSRWRFTTPTRAGKPVAVRVRQQFIFPHRS